MRRVKLCACVCALLLACASASISKARAQRATPAGDVVVVLNEQFLNSLLEAVAAQPEPPSFPLSRGGEEGKCPSRVTLLPEAAGVRTAVRFDGGRITAPVAFRGSYAAPLVGCLNFEGWADTAFDLAFDESRQSLGARITVRQLKLKNVPTSVLGGGLTGLVQDAIDERVNPVEILRAEQLGARIPVTRGGPELRLRARAVQHEVAGKELRLRISYELVQGN